MLKNKRMANHNLKIIYYLFLSLILIPVVGTSALTKDSLLLKLATSKEDTTTIKILNALSRELIKSNPSKAIIYGKQSLQLARTINNSAGIGDVLEILGLIYNEQSSFDSSEEYFKEAIKG